MATLVDWKNVDQRIESLRTSTTFTRGDAFARFTLVTLLGLHPSQVEELITDGSRDRGVDAIHIDRKREPNQIHFFQFKCHDSYRSSSKNFPGNEISKLRSYIDDLLTCESFPKSNCNEILYARTLEVREVLSAEQCEIFVHLCSNGEKLHKNDETEFIEFLKPLSTFHLRQHDLKDLSLRLLRTVPSNLHMRLTSSGKPGLEKSDGELRGLVLNVSSASLYEALFDSMRPDQPKQILFHNNLRNFLGFENHINWRIFQSASSEENHRFWYLNNGITIVCSKFNYQPRQTNCPVELRRPQIVNGAQTCHALFDAYKEGKADLSNVFLLVRIYETEDPELTDEIARATNNQTKIGARDLRANDDLLKKIESVFLGHGYFLERKRYQHHKERYELRIDAFRLGQVCWAYILEEPDRARTQSDEIFGSHFEEIFKSALNIEDGVAAYKFFQHIESVSLNPAVGGV